jgi:hypothetical protein
MKLIVDQASESMSFQFDEGEEKPGIMRFSGLSSVAKWFRVALHREADRQGIRIIDDCNLIATSQACVNATIDIKTFQDFN